MPMSIAPIARTKPSAVRDHLADDGRARERGFRRVAALRGDPALVHRECRAVLDRGRGAGSSFLLVDAEIGEREQMSAGAEDELGEVGRPLTAQRRDRLADLERVADRAARAAGPCP